MLFLFLSVVFVENVGDTPIGNLLVQAMALGELKFLPKIRTVARGSSDLPDYKSVRTFIWNKAFEIF